ncbi:MAG: phosphatase PAP2 family protein [Chitinophagaceae bacterium]
MSNPLKIFSNICSVVFHPVFVPTWLFAFLYFFSSSIFYGLDPKTKTLWFVMVMYISILFPLLTVFLLWKLKFIESIHMRGLKERYGPLIASMLFYFWLFWVFHKRLDAHIMIQTLLGGVFLTTVFVFLASIFYKISMHTSSWGAACLYALIYLFNGYERGLVFFSIILVLAGIVGTARLYLGAHSKKEIYSGYVLGMLAQLITYFVLQSLKF